MHLTSQSLVPTTPTLPSMPWRRLLPRVEVVVNVAVRNYLNADLTSLCHSQEPHVTVEARAINTNFDFAKLTSSPSPSRCRRLPRGELLTVIVVVTSNARTQESSPSHLEAVFISSQSSSEQISRRVLQRRIITLLRVKRFSSDCPPHFPESFNLPAEFCQLSRFNKPDHSGIAAALSTLRDPPQKGCRETQSPIPSALPELTHEGTSLVTKFVKVRRIIQKFANN